MNNILRTFVIVVGTVLVVTTGIIAYYLRTLSTDIQYIHELNKQTIHKTYKQDYEYQCKRLYLFADRTRGGEGHVYVVLRRPRS